MGNLCLVNAIYLATGHDGACIMIFLPYNIHFFQLFPASLALKGYNALVFRSLLSSLSLSDSPYVKKNKSIQATTELVHGNY